jgi:hypothetical protein
VRISVREVSLVLLFMLAVGQGCSSDRRGLGLKPNAAGAGGRGGGGAGGLAGKGGAITKPDVAGSSGVDPDKHVEPPGRSVYTVVHGVVDAGLTAWCFARVRDGERELVGEPVPPDGLPYGASMSFEVLPFVDSEQDGVVPFVIAGELELIEGLDCEQAVARAEAEMRAWTPPNAVGGAGGMGGEAGLGGAAGAAGEGSTPELGGAGGAAGESAEPPPSFEPAALRVGELPGLAPGTLAKGLHVLEVADGCFGSPVYTHRFEQFACGFEYTPARGSLSAEVAVLARATVFDKLSLQAFHASRGSARLGMRSTPLLSEGGTPVTLVDNFTIGALRPRTPRSDLPTASWGVNVPSWAVEGTVDGTAYAADLWLDIRERAGIDELETGRGYTLIAIGPAVDIESDGFWNDFKFALVDNEPERSTP